MGENKLLSVSIFILALSIFFCAFWIGHSMKSPDKPTNSISSETSGRILMTEKETTEYLNMTQKQFTGLLSYEERSRQGLATFNTYQFIPFIEIDGLKYFNKVEISKWIQYNSEIRSEFHTGS